MIVTPSSTPKGGERRRTEFGLRFTAAALHTSFQLPASSFQLPASSEYPSLSLAMIGFERQRFIFRRALMRRAVLPVLTFLALALSVVAAQQPSQAPGQLRPRPGTGREPEFP